MGRITMILIALAISSAAFCSSAIADGEKLEKSSDVRMVERSVPIPILTLVEGVSSFSQSNPPKSKTMFVLRAMLPETSSHPRMQEYIRLGQDSLARKVFDCIRSEAVDSTQRALFDCRLDRLTFRAPLSAQSSGDVEIAVDGGLYAIVGDVVDSKFDRPAFEKESQATQQGYFGNVLELLVFPSMG